MTSRDHYWPVHPTNRNRPGERAMAAECDDGEHTSRFHFLATVRTLVATVVAMLVAAVVVMVIVMVRRPVEMEFRSYGYVQAEDWRQIRANVTPPDAAAPLYEYGPATEVDILLLLSAVNPSGRGEINGSIDIIRIVDVETMAEFCVFEPRKVDPDASVSFDLPRHTFYRYRRWVHMRNAGQLQYLYDNHSQDDSGFSVLLVVEAKYEPQGHPAKKNMVYYCSPVTFIRIGVQTLGGPGHVTCQTAHDMGYTPKFDSKL